MKFTIEAIVSYIFLVTCVVEPVSIKEAKGEALEILKRAPRVKRVINGHDLERGKWTFLVHLRAKVAVKFFWGIPYSYHNYYCGGTLISKRWVVTAAHCFKSSQVHPNAMKSKYWHIKAGEEESQHGIIDKAKSFLGRIFGRDDWRLWDIHAVALFIHPDYNEANNWANDMALIYLREELPVSTSSRIGVASLLSNYTNWPPVGLNCIFLGWGCDERGGHIVNQGQQVSLPIMSGEACRQAYGYSFSTDSRVCAGGRNIGKGICAGDSGGPLICVDPDGVQVLVGVATFTSAYHPADYPGVFTIVSQKVRWIRNTMKLKR